MLRPAAALALAVLCSGCGRQEHGSVTLAVVGDVLLGRGVGKAIAKRGEDYPFSGTRDTIQSADIAFCNLECTLSTRGVAQHRKFLLRGKPELAGAMARAGFDVASLANNHTLDYGREAMADTIDAVRGAGMLPVGAGRNRSAAARVGVLRRNGLKVGFLAYTDIPNAGVVRLADKPTVAAVESRELPGEVRRAKAQCDALVVSFHWGVEYTDWATRRQRMLARKAIDAGADLIVGHHPHVLQPVETYRGKPIIYSAGAFVWDARIFGATRSAIYVVELGRSSAKLVRTVPVEVVNCRPRQRVGAKDSDVGGFGS